MSFPKTNGESKHASQQSVTNSQQLFGRTRRWVQVLLILAGTAAIGMAIVLIQHI